MATTVTSGIWKGVTGTLQEVIDELKGDGITDATKVAGLTHDGTNFNIVYKYK